jgi:hypothetical protein
MYLAAGETRGGGTPHSGGKKPNHSYDDEVDRRALQVNPSGPVNLLK